MNFAGYFNDQAKQIEFNNQLEEMKKVQFECAQLLIKAGLKVGELATKGKLGASFIACSNQNFSLAEYLLKLDPKSSEGIMQDSKQNILHLISKDFYLEQNNFLEVLVKYCKVDELKKLAKEIDSNGYTPYQLYFTQLSEVNLNIQYAYDE